MSITSTTAQSLVLDAGVVYVNYGVAGERILGATEGGNTFTIEREIRDIPVDGIKGKTKGLRRIIREDAKLVVNLKEVTKDNIILALTGAASDAAATATMTGEYLGLGTAGAESFTFAQAPIGNIKFYVDGVQVNWTLGVHYTIITTALTIIGINTIAESAELTTSYVYSSGAPTHDEIRSTQAIANADYKDNVALVATLSGSTEPVVCLIENVISDGNFEIGVTDKNEAVVKVEFSAHWDMNNTDGPDGGPDAPWAVRYPK